MDFEQFKKIQAVLREQEEEERAKQEEEDRRGPLIDQEAFDEMYRLHGMMAPIKGYWKRPIHKGLYTCPLSQPITTLVRWEALPHHVRQYYTKPTNGSGVLEVLRSHLVADGVEAEGPMQGGDPQQQQQGGGQGLINRRPLGANLSTKLSEYTRGATGQCNPFRPGGVDQDELKDENEIDPFLTEEAIQNSLKVLEQGVKASWEDGTLITAPPGVSFKVGLSYEDVHGVDPEVERKKEEQRQREQAAAASQEQQNELSSAGNAALRTAPAIRWDQAFMDDDSLFGSSDESESDSDEDDDEDENENDGDAGGKAKSTDEPAKEKEKTAKDKEPTAAETKEEANIESITGSDEDIDTLLQQLSRAEMRTRKEIDTKNKMPKEEIKMNALELAERQAALQKDKDRKMWASTDLLPIDDFDSLIPNPAMKYPFELDTFQQQAVARLERNESVFVAAHTSAGKTVVAEYASALSKQRGTRCIYTSPIKALSNQKFRDFSKKFGAENVGLITGDLQLNADDSTILIMTTEILRSMLYRGADLIRDVEFVIFDEVHYVNDSERGVVWEEVIIMLPQYVNLIFLSATTPNTLEFSDWIGRTKRKSVHVVKTDYRPVPLSHYLWANTKLHLIRQGKSGFLDKGYQEASNALQPKKATDKKGGKGGKTVNTNSNRRGPEHMAWQAQGSKANWMSLIRFLDREDLTPTVVFSFSKKKCEEIAYMLRSLDLNTASERSAVQGFTLQTIARLSPNDAVLPQVLTVADMVQRGIGVHHGGLLPILKEMVEILFARGLIKVLFATETFAMGVNMPARSVVFNSIRKHDGTQFRVLEPGEYTQMAGRAGRRGLDKVGTVIMCCFGDTPPPVGILRNMLTGQSTMLKSQFRLTYNMILNLLRVEEMSVEGMIKRSFSEFATQRALTANEYPKLLARGEKTLQKLEQQRLATGKIVGAEDLDDYFETCSELISTNAELISVIAASSDGVGDTVFNPGRILLVSAARDHGVVRAPALVLHTRFSKAASSIADAGRKIDSVVCMVLLPESFIKESADQADGKGHAAHKADTVGYIGSAKHRHYSICEMSLEQILLISSKKKKIDVSHLFVEKSATAAAGGRGRSSADFFGGAPARGGGGGFDNAFAGMKARGKKNDDDDFFGKKKKSAVSTKEQSIDDAMELLISTEKEEVDTGLAPMSLRDTVKRGNEVMEFRNQCSHMEDLVGLMRTFASHRHPSLDEHYGLVERQHTLQKRVDALKHLLSNESLQLFPDFLQRKSVLKTLGYIDEHEAVCVKGRVACEVNTCEELIVTEMIFEGILNELEPTEIVAALSSLLYQQKSDDDEFDMEIPETLLNCCKQMKKIATNLGQLQREHGLDIDPIDYADSTLKFGLVHVVYEWALGVPFKNICELTTAQEGSIVRCITRLDELCREVRNCARVVGNPTLYRKMEAASAAIKRDIVFASSLYVS
mmetsp:Transcript_7652/g.18427  ORF Transcript_7652/g.18427 Transcript_7652/m.18427 type:complete len:1449 (-) Transcript_7652:38-4384(-)